MIRGQKIVTNFRNVDAYTSKRIKLHLLFIPLPPNNPTSYCTLTGDSSFTGYCASNGLLRP
jgi:hypothetical protein